MKIAKKENPDMQPSPQVINLKPIPRKEKTEERLVQAYVPVDLWKAIKKEIDSRGLDIKEAVVFGLRSFLLVHAPKEAAKLGITSEE
jgi:hypothetical protein